MKNIKCRNCFFYRNEWCEKIVDSPDPEEARDCNYFREMTNADRIRAMSDEELAVLIAREIVHVPHSGFYVAKSAWLRWLHETVEEQDG